MLKTFNAVIQVRDLNSGNPVVLRRQYRAPSMQQAVKGFNSYLKTNKTIKPMQGARLSMTPQFKRG